MTDPGVPLPDIGAELRRSLVALAEAARPVIEQFKEAWKQAVPALQAIAEGFRTLPERSSVALLQLGAQGWYLDPSLPASALFELAEAFSGESKERANELLCKWIDEHLSETEELLAKRFPNRKDIFQEAFKAHSLKLYAASIPLFLAQADGICQQLHGVQLFKKLRSGRLLLKERVEKLEIGEYEKAFLAPLLEPLPITASAKERLLLSNNLNRHAIIHGESIDYGTHENSCRAISLITYASWVLVEIMPNQALKPTGSPPLRSGEPAA